GHEHATTFGVTFLHSFESSRGQLFRHGRQSRQQQRLSLHRMHSSRKDCWPGKNCCSLGRSREPLRAALGTIFLRLAIRKTQTDPINDLLGATIKKKHFESLL